MFGIRKLIDKLKIFKNYIYYVGHSIGKNVYPSKIVGEKITDLKESVIIVKISGKDKTECLPLHTIFYDQGLIASFSPQDALRLGKLAFNHIVIGPLEPKESLNKFVHIKQAMLASTHDIYNIACLPDIKLDTGPDLEQVDLTLGKQLSSLIANNKYPFKLVGQKEMKNVIETTILYTIFGKREGYQKVLNDSIDPIFIEKFHPTEAIKFGFILAGIAYFLNQ